MRTLRWMVASAVAMALAGCGADEISSPGSGGNVTINNPPPPAAPTPDPTPQPTLVTPAAGCPTIANPTPLQDDGTITGPTGTYRVCTLPSVLTANTTLTRIPGLLYSLSGRVNVGVDRGAAPTADAPVVLTIQPGVVIYAQTGTSWLAVNRGNRIQAAGTATQPIVFTSRDNVLGLTNDDSQGQWGGVVLMGRAPITDCTVAPSATPGTVACERFTEGSTDAAIFGGATPDDNSGTIKYVQIRYSGYVLSGNNELQSLTLEGVGSGTTIDYFQSHNSSDDGFENFGGRAKMRHIIVTGADDDNIDLDTGYKGTLQYVIAVQKTGTPDSIIELDSANALEDNTPRTYMKIANFTFVHRNLATANQAAMLFRGKADAMLLNGVVTSPTACLRLNGANILTTDAATDKVGPPEFYSVLMQCGGTTFVGTPVPTPTTTGLTNDQVAATFNAGTNNSATFTASLSNTFVNGTNETAAVAIDPKTKDSAFDTTNYVGAVKDANDTWYAGWTCNSATASFGTTSTACTSLPSLLQ
jgi:hypothetical protein